MKKKFITSLAAAALAGVMLIAMPATAFAHDAAPGLKNASYTKNGTTEYFAVDVTDPDDPSKTISSEDDWFKADWTVKLDGAEVAYNEEKNWTAGVDGYAFDKNKGQVLLDSDLFTKPGKGMTYSLVISAVNPDHVDATATMTVNNYGADTLTFRQIDKDGNVVKTYTFTMDQIKNNEKKVEGVRYETVCGMSHGVMGIKADGVYLTDLLDQAGIDFGPGMTLQYHTNDQAKVYNTVDEGSDYFTIKYEDLMVPRYEFPGIYKDMSVVEDLSATMPHLGKEFRDKIMATSQGEYTKVEVDPLISYGYVEKDLANVISAGDVNCIANGTYTERFSAEKSFRIFYGLSLTEDGSTITDEVTTAENAYCIFDIDVIEGEASSSQAGNSTEFSMLDDLRAEIEDAFKLFYDNGVQYPDGYDITEDPNGLLLKMPFCTMDTAELYFTALSNTSSTTLFNGIEGVSSYGTETGIRTPIYVLRNCKHFQYRINDSMIILAYVKKAVNDNGIVAADAELVNGKAIPVITFNGTKLVEGVDYTATYTNNDKVGTATAVIVGTCETYAGTATVTFNVKEAAAPTPEPAKAKAQKITGKNKITKNFKAKNLKKKAASFNIGAKANTKLTYKVTKKNAKIKFKNGKVTVKKGTKKGTYTIKVKITAKATDAYESATKTVTVTVKVK